jgi:cytoskeletal protein CcmA (bactofilin family)
MTGGKTMFAKGDAKPSSASEEISAFLGKETVFEGKMTFQGVFRLDGNFQGEIFESGNLVVGESAVVKGKVGVQTMVIHGVVEGEVRAGARVEIHATGKFSGNLFTPVLLIQEGGVFEGHCKMKQPPDKEADLQAPDREKGLPLSP